MIRAVLDVNVLISAFIRPKSPPGQILRRLVEDEGFELVLSEPILEELARALRYPDVKKRLGLSEEELDLRVAMLDALAIPVEGNVEVSGACKDPDDDKLLAAAVEACADFLVTGDKGVLEIGQYENVRVVTPRAFLDLLGG